MDEYEADAATKMNKYIELLSETSSAYRGGAGSIYGRKIILIDLCVSIARNANHDQILAELRKAEYRYVDASYDVNVRVLFQHAVPDLPLNPYKEGQGQRECSICLQDFKDEATILTLSCGHAYHTNCIAKWFKLNTKCPYCRQEQMTLANLVTFHQLLKELISAFFEYLDSHDALINNGPPA